MFYILPSIFIFARGLIKNSDICAKSANATTAVGLFGIEMIEMENGGIVKSIHGDLYKDSIWYTVYGSKGRMESAREDAKLGDVKTIYVNFDEESGAYGTKKLETYNPVMGGEGKDSAFGHGGSDFYSMYHFIEKIQGNPDADTIDVYEALDMFLPGMFAYRSVMAGGIPMDIPNLRDKAVRELWRHDTACTDPKVAGDMLLPVFSKGNEEIPEEIYDRVREKWLAHLEQTAKK